MNRKEAIRAWVVSKSPRQAAGITEINTGYLDSRLNKGLGDLFSLKSETITNEDITSDLAVSKPGQLSVDSVSVKPKSYRPSEQNVINIDAARRRLRQKEGPVAVARKLKTLVPEEAALFEGIRVKNYLE